MNDQLTTSGKKRIGGYLLVQEDEHAVTYVLDPTLRWIYFLILPSMPPGSLKALSDMFELRCYFSSGRDTSEGDFGQVEL